MSKKQSSIEWLVRKLSTELIGEIPLHRWDEIREVVQQAKAMHKEEMESAYLSGSADNFNDEGDFKKYYKETFGGNDE